MTLKDYLLSELDREVERSRRTLEHVPEEKYDWKPHERSMPFGYLAEMVATIPSWIAMEVTTSDFDVAPADGERMRQEPKRTSCDLLEGLDKSAASAREALQNTTDEHLSTIWKLKARGQVVQEAPRFEMIQDTINHWAHHRGQMS